MGRTNSYISLLASSGITIHEGERIRIIPTDEPASALRAIIADVSTGDVNSSSPLSRSLWSFLNEARQEAPIQRYCSASSVAAWHKDKAEASPFGLPDASTVLRVATTQERDFSADEARSIAAKLFADGFEVVRSDEDDRARMAQWPFLFFEMKKGGVVIGAGCALNAALAEIKAICEATERTVAHTENLEVALCCSAQTLEEAGIISPEFELDARDAYSRGLMLDWIPGWTLAGQRAAIPAELAYFGYVPKAGVRAFALQHTSGLAAGSTITKAIWRGLCEVIEREAYWIVMRCRICCPTLKLDDCCDEVQKLAATLEQMGIRVVLKDISLDSPLKIVHAIFVQESGRLPAFSHGIGSHLNLSQAALKAVTEGAQIFSSLRRLSEFDAAGVLLPTKNWRPPEFTWCDPSSRLLLGHLIDDPPDAKAAFAGSNQSFSEYLVSISGRLFWTYLGSQHGIHVVRVLISDAIPPNRESSFIPRRLHDWLLRLKLQYPYDTPILT